MKKIMKKFFFKALATGALSMAMFAANIACTGGHYQEKLPDSVKKFRKF